MRKSVIVLVVMMGLTLMRPTSVRGAFTVSDSDSCSRQSITITKWPNVMAEVTDPQERLDIAVGLLDNVLQCFYFGSTCTLGISHGKSWNEFLTRPNENRFIPRSYGGWQTTELATSVIGGYWEGGLGGNIVSDVLVVRYKCGSRDGSCGNWGSVAVKVGRDNGSLSCPKKIDDTKWTDGNNNTYQVVDVNETCETGWTEMDGNIITGNPYTVSGGYDRTCKLCHEGGGGQKMWTCHPYDGVRETNGEYLDTNLCLENTKQYWWVDNNEEPPMDLKCSTNQSDITNCTPKEKKQFYFCDTDYTVKPMEGEYTADNKGKTECDNNLRAYMAETMPGGYYQLHEQWLKCYENESDLGFCKNTDGGLCPPRAEVEAKGYIYTGYGATYGQTKARGGWSQLTTLISDALYAAKSYGVEGDVGAGNVTGVYFYKAAEGEGEAFELARDYKSPDDDAAVTSAISAADPYLCGVQIEDVSRRQYWYCNPSVGPAQTNAGCVDTNPADGKVDKACSYALSNGVLVVSGQAGQDWATSGYPNTEKGRTEECSYNVWDLVYRNVDGFANWVKGKAESNCYTDRAALEAAVPTCKSAQLWYCDPDEGPKEMTGSCQDVVPPGGDGKVDADCFNKDGTAKCRAGDNIAGCGYQNTPEGMQECVTDVKKYAYDEHVPVRDYAQINASFKTCYTSREEVIEKVPSCAPVTKYYCDPDPGFASKKLELACAADASGNAVEDCKYRRADGTEVVFCKKGVAVATCGLNDSETLDVDCENIVKTQYYDAKGKTAPNNNTAFYKCYDSQADVDAFCKQDSCASKGYGSLSGYAATSEGEASTYITEYCNNEAAGRYGILESHWVADNLKADGSGEMCYACSLTDCTDWYIDEKACLQGADEDYKETHCEQEYSGGDKCTVYTPQTVTMTSNSSGNNGKETSETSVNTRGYLGYSGTEWYTDYNYRSQCRNDAYNTFNQCYNTCNYSSNSYWWSSSWWNCYLNCSSNYWTAYDNCHTQATTQTPSNYAYTQPDGFRYFLKDGWRKAPSQGQTECNSPYTWRDCAGGTGTPSYYYWHMDSDGQGDAASGEDNGSCTDSSSCPAGWVDMSTAFNNEDPYAEEETTIAAEGTTVDGANNVSAARNSRTQKISTVRTRSNQGWTQAPEYCGWSGCGCNYSNPGVAGSTTEYRSSGPAYDADRRTCQNPKNDSGNDTCGWYDECWKKGGAEQTGNYYYYSQWRSCYASTLCYPCVSWYSDGSCRTTVTRTYYSESTSYKKTDCAQNYWDADEYVNADDGCQQTRLCGRQLSVDPIKVEQTFPWGENTGCAEENEFSVHLTSTSSKGGNAAECTRDSVTMDGNEGDPMVHNFNPCTCKPDSYEVTVRAEDGAGNQVDFKPIEQWDEVSGATIPSEELAGKCVVLWHQLAARDGINGTADAWGSAGKNGHWVLDGMNDADGNKAGSEAVVDGWTWDETNCKFVCAGDKSGNGVECYGETLHPRIYFVPDFRFVAYQDENRQASYLPDKDDNLGGQNNACSVGGSEVGTGSGVFGEETYYTFRNGSNNITGAYDPVFRDKMNAGGFREMYFGEILASEVGVRAEFLNTTDGEGSQTTVDCTCPSLALKDSSGGTTGEFGNCSYDKIEFNSAGDVCTTKRLYALVNEDYTSAWWQVSGGNVYAFGNIKDRIPNNETTLAGTQCLDMNYPSALADFSGINEYFTSGGNRSCTPRILRGRTPCKDDGPSNSAGVVLTQVGSIDTFNDRDDNVDNTLSGGNWTDAKAQLLAQRFSERSYIHALYAGSYVSNSGAADVDNSSNKNGLQSRISSSNAKPIGEGIAYDTDLKQMTGDPSDLGYVPPREDFNYFLNLANSAAQEGSGMQIGPGGRVATSTHLSDLVANKDSQCVKMQESNSAAESYVCYIVATGEGGLVIDANNPWILSKDISSNLFRKYTVFVDGNVTIKNSWDYDDNNHNNDASIAVDVGNFLSLIVKGNVVVEPNVGLTLPNPYTFDFEDSTAVLNPQVEQCWEGQSATVPNHTPNSSDVPGQNSAAGVTEGIFIADGNLTIKRERNVADCNAVTDKRYIHQGSMIVWGNATLERDFSNRERGCQDDAFGIYNNRIPAETFIYRPDLVVNIPSWMRRSTVYTYQE